MNNPQVVTAVYQDGELLFTSPNWQEMSGYTPEETLGRGFLSQIWPEDRERVLDCLQQSRGRGASRWINRCRTKEGKPMSFLVVATPLSDGRTALAWTPITSEEDQPVSLSSLAKLESTLRASFSGDRSRQVVTVSFDMDGVLANHFQKILELSMDIQSRVWADYTQLTCSPDCKGCNASICFQNIYESQRTQMSREEFAAAKLRAIHSPLFWSSLEPMNEDHLREVADLCNSSRIVPVFVANRCHALSGPVNLGDARIQSINWLKRHGFEYVINTAFTCQDKVPELLMREVQYHIDDDPDDVMQLRGVGIEAYLVKRPWNESVWGKNKGVPSEFCVKDVLEFCDIVAPASLLTEEETIYA